MLLDGSFGGCELRASCRWQGLGAPRSPGGCWLLEWPASVCLECWRDAM